MCYVYTSVVVEIPEDCLALVIAVTRSKKTFYSGILLPGIAVS